MKKTILLASLLLLLFPVLASAQAEEGALLNPNTAEKDALVAAGFSEKMADGIHASRPIADIAAFDTMLTEHGMSREEITAIYAHVFLPIDLNTASREAILLIPGVGKRMAHEFEEYRPYRAMAQFHKEIGKYVDDEEVARLARYVMISE